MEFSHQVKLPSSLLQCHVSLCEIPLDNAIERQRLAWSKQFCSSNSVSVSKDKL